jgi:hypothetical protein
MGQLLESSILIGLGATEYEHRILGGCVATLIIIMISSIPVLGHLHLIFLSDMLPIGDAIFGEVGHGEAVVLTWAIHNLSNMSW